MLQYFKGEDKLYFIVPFSCSNKSFPLKVCRNCATAF